MEHADGYESLVHPRIIGRPRPRLEPVGAKLQGIVQRAPWIAGARIDLLDSDDTTTATSNLEHAIGHHTLLDLRGPAQSQGLSSRCILIHSQSRCSALRHRDTASASHRRHIAQIKLRAERFILREGTEAEIAR